MNVNLQSVNPIRAALVDRRGAYRLVMAVLALNVPLILVILLRYVEGSNLTWLTWFYISNVALGYYALPLLVVVTLLFLLLMPVHRIAAIGSGIIVVLFIYYLILDSVVYGIFKFHIDPFWVEFALKDCASLGVPRSTIVASLALLPAVALVELGVFAVASRFAAIRRWVLAFPFLVVAAFGVSQTIHVVTYERNDQRITSLTPCLPVYVPITSHRNAVKYGSLLQLGEADSFEDAGGYAGASLRYPLGDLRFDSSRDETPPNIVVILLESWRFDAFDEKTTPHIYALGRESSVFLDHLSSGNQTTCGIFGLFYGLHATYWTAVKANSASIDNPSLIDILKEHGYAFGIYADSNFKRHKIEDTIFKGIEVHEKFSGRSIPAQDAEMTQQVSAFIEERVRAGTPFMALAFYKSCHAPYEYPREHAILGDTKNVGIGLSGDTDPAPYLRDYRNSLHYADALAGEIISRLRTLGVLERTIIIVTTDHGESFNEQGSNFWGHGSNFSENQVRVPFILHAPGRAPARIERRTSHIDLVPTLLQDYFACTSDIAAYSNGRNLFDETQGSRALVIGSYVSHAFIFGDDVYEILPARTRKYSLRDLHGDASAPASAMLRTVMDEMNRFVKRGAGS